MLPMAQVLDYNKLVYLASGSPSVDPVVVDTAPGALDCI